jgi:maltose alpha-D-glucosyltransferase/alpha-amylase
MLGLTEFPKIGQQPYFLTIPPYYFYWFRLQLAPAPVTALRAPEAAVPVDAALPAFFMGVTWDTLLDGNVRTLIERESLVPFLQRQRWFGGKARAVRAARVLDWGLLRKGPHPIFVTIVGVDYEDGGSERYLVPLAVVTRHAAEAILARTPQAALAHVTGARKGVVIDGTADDLCAQALLETFDGDVPVRTKRGTVRPRRTPAFHDLRGVGGLAPKRVGAEQSNTSIAYGDRLILKLFRRVENGPNPDVEIGEQLTMRTSFRRAPRLAASIDYETPDDAVACLGVAQQFVNSQGDGWSHALGELRRFYDDVTVRGGPNSLWLPAAHLFELATAPAPQEIRDLTGAYLESAQVLGRRTAELHLALAGEATSATFAPEPWTRDDTARLCAGAAGQADRARVVLASQLPGLSPEMAAAARELVDRAAAGLRERYDFSRTPAAASSAGVAPGGVGSRIRIHGDYHLGQVLWAEGDFYILDFEGEPARPLDERRRKESPLKDVAGMLRSFSYAAHAALFAHSAGRGGEYERTERWARVWERWTSAAFLKGYLAAAGAPPFLPADPVERAARLDLFLLDKALYELNYELNSRPDWARIPLRGLSEWLG